VSDTDGFIDEVSEEIRRDRNYRLMRKWGWIPVSLILLLVGGSAFNEWSKARATRDAEALAAKF